jgi:exodeoxyribonuclease VII small subunit
MTFEQYAKRLAEISEKLENADITLDESIALFEESVRLSSECMKILKEKKGKITRINKELDGIAGESDEL